MLLSQASAARDNHLLAPQLENVHPQPGHLFQRRRADDHIRLDLLTAP
jgi:hypothetical protein